MGGMYSTNIIVNYWQLGQPTRSRSAYILVILDGDQSRRADCNMSTSARLRGPTQGRRERGRLEPYRPIRLISVALFCEFPKSSPWAVRTVLRTFLTFL